MPENYDDMTLTEALKVSMEHKPTEFKSDTTSSFVLARYDKNDKDEPYKKVSARTCESARIDIKVADEYLRLDFEFDKPSSPDLAMLWGFLEEYGELSDRIDGDDDPHFMTLILQPNRYFGKYTVGLTSPVFWAPIPTVISQEEFSKLRIVFALKNVELLIRDYSDEPLEDTEDSDTENEEDTDYEE